MPPVIIDAAPAKWAPSASAGVSVSVPVSWASTAAWTEIISSTTSAISVFAVVTDTQFQAGGYEFDVGIGALGAETAIATIPFETHTSTQFNDRGLMIFPIPVGIAISTRVSVRIRSGSGFSATVNVSIGYFDALGVSTVKATGTFAGLPSNADPVTVTPSSTNWANSSWVQVTASSGSPLQIAGITVFNNTANVEYEVDIGTGGAGSEVVLTTIRGYWAAFNPGRHWMPLPHPANVVSSTRLSVRVRKGGTSTSTFLVKLASINESLTPSPITGTGGVTIGAPTLLGSGGLSVSGSGGVTIGGPTLSGTGTVDDPNPSRSTQVGLEVFGAAAPSKGRSTQVGAELFGVGANKGRSTQVGIESFGIGSTKGRSTQVGVEVFGKARPAQFVNAKITIGLTWIEVTTRSGAFYVWSDRPLPDPAFYYGGWKEARVLQWGDITRSLSNRWDGQYTSSSTTVLLSDVDRLLRQLDDDNELLGATFVIRMISDEGRRALQTPRVVYRGTVRDIKPTAQLRYTLTLNDIFATIFDANTSDSQLPRRVVSVGDFPQCTVDTIPSSAERYASNGGAAIAATTANISGGRGQFANGDTVQWGGHTTVYTVSQASGTDPETNIQFSPALTASVANGETLTQIASHKITPSSGVRVPAVYGHITDRNVTTSGVIASSLPTLDPTLGRSNLIGQIGGAGDLRTATNPTGHRWAYVAALTAGGIGSLSNEGGNIFRPDDANNPSGVRVQFTKVAGGTITGYRVFLFDAPECNPYGSFGSAVNVIYKDHDNVTFDSIQAGGDFEVNFTSWTDGTSLTGGSSGTSADAGKGQGPVTYVGDRIMADGRTYGEFLWSGHACYSPGGIPIDMLYFFDRALDDLAAMPLKLNGVALTVGTLATEAAANGRIAVPGYGNWAAVGRTGTFVDYSTSDVVLGVTTTTTRRYTVFYLRGIFRDWALGLGGAPDNLSGKNIAVSGYGVESVGDGSGTLISRLFQQYKHAIVNWCPPIGTGYQSGAWLSPAAFPDDASVPTVDEASFDIADLQSEAYVTGGFRGDFIIGANNEAVSFRTLVSRFNVSTGGRSGFNTTTQFFVNLLNTDLGTTTLQPELSWVLDIFSGSWDIVPDVKTLYTDIEYQATQDYLGRSSAGWESSKTGISEDISATAETVYGSRTQSPVLSFYMVRGQNNATDPAEYVQGSQTVTAVLALKHLTNSFMPRVPKFATGPAGFNYELAQIVPLTHYEGLTTSGWTLNPAQLELISISPGSYTTKLESFDVGHILS